MDDLSSRFNENWVRVPQPLVPLADLPGGESDPGQSRPMPIEVLGRSVVVASAEGCHSILDDRCPHRGAALRLGTINKRARSVRCRYHGFEWSFSGDLRCIPAYEATGRPCPRNARWRLPSFPSSEAYGLLWGHLYGADGFALPRFDILADPRLMPGAWVVRTIAAGAGRVIEGTIDPYHIAFTHSGTIGTPELPEAPSVHIESRVDHLYMRFELLQMNNLSIDHGPGAIGLASDVCYEQWVSCNVVFLLKTSKAGRFGLLFVFRAVGPACTTMMRRIYCDYGFDRPEVDYLDLEKRIDDEDQEILEHVMPSVIDLENSPDLHCDFDEATRAYRLWMQQRGFTMI